MIDLIQKDINTIIQQYGDKNINIALLITAFVVLIMVWRFIFMIVSGKAGHVDMLDGNIREHIRAGISQGIWFLCFFLFVYYFCYLIELTLLTREAGSRTDVNLRFLGTWHPDLYSQCFMVENVLLFLPFGIFIVLLCPPLKKMWRVLLLSFLLSFSVEVAQLLTERGFFQVDDIWLNTLGGLSGGIFGNIFRKIIKLKKNLLE